MPELPEVETSRRGIAPHIEGAVVAQVILRHTRLRYPIPSSIKRELPGQRLQHIERRGKYLLLSMESGTLIIHLGMSGSLRLVDASVRPEKHDHVDIAFDNGTVLRLRDPRRFGALLWTQEDWRHHPLIEHLGPEPLSRSFSGDYLYGCSQGRSQAVKTFIMDSRIVVGVGNIYANEALFMAGIDPRKSAGDISLRGYRELAKAIKEVLRAAIRQGGTTLRDFVDGSGKPGYFSQKLKVYGREGESCPTCGKAIRQIKMGQRATYYCPSCQKK